MELAAALELSDIRRNQQLGERLWTPLTREVVNDKQLEQRYRAAGIGRGVEFGEHLRGPGAHPALPELEPRNVNDMCGCCLRRRPSWQ